MNSRSSGCLLCEGKVTGWSEFQGPGEYMNRQVYVKKQDCHEEMYRVTVEPVVQLSCRAPLLKCSTRHVYLYISDNSHFDDEQGCRDRV